MRRSQLAVIIYYWKFNPRITMKPLLQPAIALMQRLRLLPKFALMCLAFLTPLLLVTSMLIPELQKSIATTGQERLGLTYIAHLHELTGLIQQRRALEHLRLSTPCGAQ
jgi:methyl-accepting chemotaxis protein